PAAVSFAPYPDQFCQDIRSACFTAKNLIDECITYAGDTTTESWSSCTCRSSFLRMDYSCEYMGNKTCLGIGATLSSVWGYIGCDNFASVIGTGLVSLKYRCCEDRNEADIVGSRMWFRQARRRSHRCPGQPRRPAQRRSRA